MKLDRIRISITKKIGIVALALLCSLPSVKIVDSFAETDGSLTKRTTPNCVFDIQTKQLSSIPENSSILINNQLITPNAVGYIDLSPYLSQSDYYNIVVIANGSGSYANSEPQIIQVQKPETPKAVFDGASRNLYALSDGMVYSLDGGHTWTQVTGGATSVKLTFKQIDVASTYGYICVKQTIPSDSEIEFVFIGRMPQPSGIWSIANTLCGLNGELEYKHESLDNWTTATGSQATGLIPGIYKVRTKAKSYYAASESVDVYVNSNGGYSPTPTPSPNPVPYTPTKEATPNATFNGHTLRISGVSGCRMSFDGGRSYTDTQYLDIIQLKLKQINPGYGIVLYRPGNGYTTSDSDKQVITVYQQPAPSGVKASHTTDDAPGKLKHVDSSMQYKKKGDDHWTDVPAGQNSVKVKPGTYQIRRHGYGEVLPSTSVTVEVKDNRNVYYVFEN